MGIENIIDDLNAQYATALGRGDVDLYHRLAAEIQLLEAAAAMFNNGSTRDIVEATNAIARIFVA